jgi:hypothetical protein
MKAAVTTTGCPETCEALEAATGPPLKKLPNYEIIISKLLFLRIVLSLVTTSYTHSYDETIKIRYFYDHHHHLN